MEPGHLYNITLWMAITQIESLQPGVNYHFDMFTKSHNWKKKFEN